MFSSVDLGKRAEAYVWFAAWCKEHNVSAWHAAECIELYNQIRKKKGWDRRRRLIAQIEERLRHAGMINILFDDDEWPSFECPRTGERIHLPIREFI